MKSNAIFMKFHARLQSTDFVLDKILIPEDEHENEYEKNQINSHLTLATLLFFLERQDLIEVAARVPKIRI